MQVTVQYITKYNAEYREERTPSVLYHKQMGTGHSGTKRLINYCAVETCNLMSNYYEETGFGNQIYNFGKKMRLMPIN